MQPIKITADVPENREVVIRLPPEVPVGKVQLYVTLIDEHGLTYTQGTLPPTSLAEWAEQNAEHWGDRIKSTDVEGFTGRRY